MTGGKSKSSQESTQQTITKSVDAVAGGDILQGDNISITENFPEGVQQAFEQLVSLASKSIDLTRDAGSAAITAVQSSIDNAQNPTLAETKQISPAIYLIAMGVIVYIVMRK
jgi:hypothetical protein